MLNGPYYIVCVLYEPIIVQGIDRAWKRSTSRKRRQLRETLVIYNKLFIYGLWPLPVAMPRLQPLQLQDRKPHLPGPRVHDVAAHSSQL